MDSVRMRCRRRSLDPRGRKPNSRSVNEVTMVSHTLCIVTTMTMSICLQSPLSSAGPALLYSAVPKSHQNHCQMVRLLRDCLTSSRQLLHHRTGLRLRSRQVVPTAPKTSSHRPATTPSRSASPTPSSSPRHPRLSPTSPCPRQSPPHRRHPPTSNAPAGAENATTLSTHPVGPIHARAGQPHATRARRARHRLCRRGKPPRAPRRSYERRRFPPSQRRLGRAPRGRSQPLPARRRRRRRAGGSCRGLGA